MKKTLVLALAAVPVAVVVVLSVFFLSKGTPFLEGFVPAEAGFEGAVSIVDMKQERNFGIVTARVPYLGIEGDRKTGLARLVVHRRQVESGLLVPAFCHVHYEKDIGGAKKWAERGWVVFTAVYTDKEGESPIDCSVGNGYNLAHAIIQWVRRLPFVDRTRLHIDGGSQGGYMALAMSADFFPVTSATADVPVVNWAYNLSYFEANKAVTKYPAASFDDSPLPVLASVTMLAEWSYKYFSSDLSDDAWYYVSPISCLDRIANPVLVTCATGDMLVPMEQMTRTHLRPFDPARFPQGFSRDLDTLTRCEKARVVFEDLLPTDKVALHVLPLQENSYELTRDMVKDSKKKPKHGPRNEDKPWSRDRQWSLLYLDEGGPAPQAGHTTCEWALSPDGFTDYYREAPPAPDLLNAGKLEWLLRRYTGEPDRLPWLKTGRPANRLNFANLEQRDVITGLTDYAALGDAFTKRLVDLYAACPVKPFGDTLSIEDLRTAIGSLAP